MRNALLALTLLLAPASIACGAAPEGAETGSENLGDVSSAIQGGAADTSAAHNYAVGVANKLGGLCSGTLIAPNLVLTARHCVVPPVDDPVVTCKTTFAAPMAADDLYVTTEANLLHAKSYYHASEIVVPQDTSFCGNDIALVILEKNVDAADAVPAVPVVQFSMTDHSKITGSIAAVGFGVTNPSAKDSGTRRVREDINITCIPGDTDSKYACESTDDIENTAEFITQGWVCSGDSGSGAFDETSFVNGTPYVMGTLSRGPQTDETCLQAIYTRTDAHADLIIATAEKAASQGGYSKAEWVAPLAHDVAPAPAACSGQTCTSVDATDPTSEEPAALDHPRASNGCSTSGVPFGGSSAAGGLLLGLALVAARIRRNG